MVLTDLFSEHIPFEFWEVFHRPNVISPPISLLTSDRLCIEHLCNAACNLFILKLDPSFRKVSFFSRSVFSPKIGTFRIYTVKLKSVPEYM